MSGLESMATPQGKLDRLKLSKSILGKDQKQKSDLLDFSASPASTHQEPSEPANSAFLVNEFKAGGLARTPPEISFKLAYKITNTAPMSSKSAPLEITANVSVPKASAEIPCTLPNEGPEDEAMETSKVQQKATRVFSSVQSDSMKEVQIAAQFVHEPTKRRIDELAQMQSNLNTIVRDSGFRSRQDIADVNAKMADNTITMYYGNFPDWRAEVCRIPLILAGVHFKDKRYYPYFNEGMERGAQEASASNAPWLPLPDGRVLRQTMAMARYYATRAGMTPVDLSDASRVDELIQSVVDFSNTLRSLFRGVFKRSNEEKMNHLNDWMEGPRKWLSYFKKQLSQSDGEFLVGSSLTIADIVLWSAINSMLDPYQHLVRPTCSIFDLR